MAWDALDNWALGYLRGGRTARAYTQAARTAAATRSCRARLEIARL